ncbi:lipopolysaccharide heptosyltransferase III [Candidatus Desulfofervidus auxilii]|uniref:Lipopolysaccharide heptosyltransferase III n=1 Tax=Desulfofervidus auxilii TaxID=1621989 RepID=A0A7U4QI68_DESA2|nr:putative lipopolysaccharide heptosyltransferase III [Candidatus Desulfofervidus auxilii]AMM39812.1 lipopolysaccharide heptosyltransferase III [Candidatus Desulfofervidus auxilii]
MRILAIKLKQIGDVLLCEPALRAIKTRFSNAHLTVIVNSYTAPMLKYADYIDELLGYDRRLKELSVLKRIKGELNFCKNFFLNNYDIAINFASGDRGAIYSLLSGAKYKIGFFAKKGFVGKNLIYDKLLIEPDTHAVMHDLYLVCEGLDILPRDYEVKLYLKDKTIEDAKNRLRKLGINQGDLVVYLHPITHWSFKSWRDDYMATVINWFLKNGIKVILGGSGEKEKRRVENILSFVNKGVINLVGRLDLEELCGIIYHCHLFFGIDTAPMHIAAALNKPVIALFGPSLTHRWGPWENNLSYPVKSFQSPYKRKGVQSLGKHIIIQKEWPCVPCDKKGCNNKGFSECLGEIKPKEVINILQEKISQLSPVFP